MDKNEQKIAINKVSNWIDSHSNELIEFCKKYVSINSVTGNEFQVQNWIKSELEEYGFDKVDFFALDFDNKRPNVVGTINGKEKCEDFNNIIINGHTDTVPINEIELKKWQSDPWQPVTRDGNIYGRGVTDMKGGISAAIYAARSLIENDIKLNGNLFLETVVGEELGEHKLGTTATVERGYKSNFAIVAEPTNCEIHTICPGAITWELFVPGKVVHNSQKNKVTYPQRYGIADGERVGVDAFKKAMKILNAWEDLEHEWNFRWKNPIMGGGGVTYSETPKADIEGTGAFGITPAIIESGDYIIAIPGFARIRGGLYHPHWVKGKDVIKEMQGVINAVAKYDDWLKENPPTLKVEYYWGPSEISKDHKGVKFLHNSLENILKEEPIYSGFTGATDSTWLYQKNIPTVVFGPGSLSYNAHGPNEFLPIDQLILASKVYASTIIKWCNKK